jgi:2Fe-2S ferredoxin
MPRITYIEHSGVEHLVDAKPGLSLMEAAVKNVRGGVKLPHSGGCVLHFAGGVKIPRH